MHVTAAGDVTTDRQASPVRLDMKGIQLIREEDLSKNA